MRTLLHAYVRRIYVHAFRTDSGLAPLSERALPGALKKLYAVELFTSYEKTILSSSL